MMEIYVHKLTTVLCYMGLPQGLSRKESTRRAGDMGSVLVLGRFPGAENNNPLPYSCPWEIPWTEESGSPLHGVTKNQTQLSD